MPIQGQSARIDMAIIDNHPTNQQGVNTMEAGSSNLINHKLV